MENNINNNINFTAKLNVRALTDNKSRWKNIAAEFERQTLKLKDDTLVLTNDNELEIAKHYGPKVTTPMSKLQYLLLTNECTEKLMQLSDEKIAKKLAQILNIFKKEEKIQHASSILYDVSKTKNKNGNTNIDKDLVYKMLDALKLKMRKDTSDSIATDTLLRNGVKEYFSIFSD